MHTTMCFLGIAFWFPIFFYLGRVRWETAPNKLRDEENKMVLCLQNRNRSVLRGLAVARNGDSCSGYAGFRPCLLPLGRHARGTQKRAQMSDLRAILRSWPRWALSLLESGIAVPATLDSGLGCFMRGALSFSFSFSCTLYLSLSLSLSFSFSCSFSPTAHEPFTRSLPRYYDTYGWIYVRTTWTYLTNIYIYDI